MEINLRQKDEIVIFDVKGEIRRSDTNEATLHKMVKDQLDASKNNILLNLHEVQFIDSFGIGEILASYISTQNSGGKLKLSNISKKLFLVFQVTMLSKVLDIYSDEESALKSF